MQSRRDGMQDDRDRYEGSVGISPFLFVPTLLREKGEYSVASRIESLLT